MSFRASLRRPLAGSLALALVLVAGAVRAEPGVSVLSADIAPSLLGHRTSSVRAYAFDDDGGPTRIPVQVDERAANGRWVLDHGRKAGGDDQPGIFDDDDVVVLMNRSLGSKADARALERLPGEAVSWLEVRVGKEASPLGHVYVGVFPPDNPTPPREPVRYDPKKDVAYAAGYAVEFDDVLPTHVAFVDGFEKRGKTFVEATHASAHAELLGGVVEIERSHRDLQERIEGWRNGPVRSIRRGRYEVALPLGFDASGRVDFIFYADFLELTGTLRLKVPPWIAGANGSMNGYVELPVEEAARAMFAAPARSAPVVAEGQKEGRQWAALILPDGRTLVMAVRLGGSLGKMEKRFYLTEPRAGDLGPLFGFELSEASRLDAGEHPFAVVGAFLRDASEEKILETARLLLDPPPVAARVLDEPRKSLRAPAS